MLQGRVGLPYTLVEAGGKRVLETRYRPCTPPFHGAKCHLDPGQAGVLRIGLPRAPMPGVPPACGRRLQRRVGG